MRKEFGVRALLKKKTMITWSFSLTAGIGSGIAASVIHERSGIEHCPIGKESEETFPFNEQCLRFKKTDVNFKYHPNLCEQKAQITVRFNFRREFAQSFMDEIFMTLKDQNHFLNYICFIFIHLANKAFQATVKTPDVVHFEFLEVEIIAFCYGSQSLDILPKVL